MLIPRSILIATATVISLVAFCQSPLTPVRFTADQSDTNWSTSFAWGAVTNGVPVQGYRFYSGPTSRFYTNAISLKSTTVTISNSWDQFFAVTAVGINGVESAFSQELNILPLTNRLVLVTVQSSPTISGPWVNLPIPPVFIQTNPPGGSLYFRFNIQRTEF